MSALSYSASKPLEYTVHSSDNAEVCGYGGKEAQWFQLQWAARMTIKGLNKVG